MNTKSLIRLAIASASLLCIALWLGGCAEKGGGQTQGVTTASPEDVAIDRRADDSHGLHEINNTRLSAIMQELAALDFDRLSAESHAGKQPYRDIGEVAEVASELAADARSIPQIYRDQDMTDESRRVFEELATRLRDEAIDLCESARRKDYPATKSRLDRVIATCNACHASFRGPQVAEAPRPDGFADAGFAGTLISKPIDRGR